MLLYILISLYSFSGFGNLTLSVLPMHVTQKQSTWKPQATADDNRRPQETSSNHRRPQKTTGISKS